MNSYIVDGSCYRKKPCYCDLNKEDRIAIPHLADSRTRRDGEIGRRTPKSLTFRAIFYFTRDMFHLKHCSSKIYGVKWDLQKISADGSCAGWKEGEKGVTAATGDEDSGTKGSFSNVPPPHCGCIMPLHKFVYKSDAFSLLRTGTYLLLR